MSNATSSPQSMSSCRWRFKTKKARPSDGFLGPRWSRTEYRRRFSVGSIARSRPLSPTLIERLTELIDLVPPVTVLAAAVGILWAAAIATAFPPPFRVFPRILVAAVVGSLVGQWLANDLSVKDVLIGDAHIPSISAGAVLVSAVVRRLSA